MELRALLTLILSRKFWQHVRWIVRLVCVSLTLGIFSNAIRDNPLLLTYQPPKERFRAAFQQLRLTPIRSAAPQPSSTSSEPIQSVEWIAPEKAKPLLGQPGIVFLDARARKRYDKSHLPGALSLPRNGFQEALPDIFSKLVAPEVKCIVVYCAGGDCDDSKSIAELLAEMKFPSVKIIKGGWQNWTKAGLPTIAGEKAGK